MKELRALIRLEAEGAVEAKGPEGAEGIEGVEEAQEV